MIAHKIVPHYSYKTLRLASVLLVCFLGFPVLAKETGEYSIDNVVVDAQGADTTKARTTALADGEKDAFKQLVTKKAPAKSAEILAKTTPAQITTMVRGFEVISEKMTANHYHATLRYNFDPPQIQALLALAAPAPAPVAKPSAAMVGPQPAAAAAAPAEAPADSAAPEHVRKAVLVLPVYKDETLKLWQDDNKWRLSWYEAALESGGGLVVAPLGDLDDRVDVDDANVMDATTVTLARMYGRYGVGEIYVVSAFYNLKADPKPTLEVVIKALKADKPEISRMNYTIHSTETLDALMVRAANDIARSIYKQQTLDPNKIEYDRIKDINARVNTSDIREWEALRQRLLAHGNIVGIKLTSISFYETTMTISFKGTPDMLGKTLVASGLRVMQDGDDLVLALR